MRHLINPGRQSSLLVPKEKFNSHSVHIIGQERKKERKLTSMRRNKRNSPPAPLDKASSPVMRRADKQYLVKQAALQQHHWPETLKSRNSKSRKSLAPRRPQVSATTPMAGDRRRESVQTSRCFSLSLSPHSADVDPGPSRRRPAPLPPLCWPPPSPAPSSSSSSTSAPTAPSFTSAYFCCWAQLNQSLLYTIKHFKTEPFQREPTKTYLKGKLFNF